MAKGESKAALLQLETSIETETDAKAAAELYKRLAKFHEDNGQPSLQALALEKASEQTPEDLSLRFNTAYAYAHADLDRLALFHYQAITRVQRFHSSALNNLAVQFAKLGLPIKAVEVYQRSHAEGYSLATANLAYLYIGSGFANEAQKLLESVHEKPDVHPNVWQAAADISAKRDAEDELEKVAIGRSSTGSAFFARVSDKRIIFHKGHAIPFCW